MIYFNCDIHLRVTVRFNMKMNWKNVQVSMQIWTTTKTTEAAVHR